MRFAIGDNLFDFEGICNALETTLRSQCTDPSGFDDRMKDFLGKYDGNSVKSDDDFFWVLVYVTFYSGMRASTIEDRLDTIKKYLWGYERVASYDDDEVTKMMNDQDMVKYERKIRACIRNALEMRRIVHEFGSFRAFLDSYETQSSSENMTKLRKELMRRFHYIGPATSFHFLMDIGLPVLKPDRVILRVFERLGLIPNSESSEENLQEAVAQGRLLSEVAGLPIRQIDVMFVSLGQLGGKNDYPVGLSHGICLESSPRCDSCGLTSYCRYYTSIDSLRMSKTKKRKRTKGKPLDEPCEICGERRWTEAAHFPLRKRDGGGDSDTICLCPTHHKLLDSGRISREEFAAMMECEAFKGRARTAEDFVEWAHRMGYPYSLRNLLEKFWDYQH